MVRNEGGFCLKIPTSSSLEAESCKKLVFYETSNIMFIRAIFLTLQINIKIQV